MLARFVDPTVRKLALGAAALVLSLASPGALGEARAEVKLRLTHSAPVSHPNHIAAEKMVQRMKEILLRGETYAGESIAYRKDGTEFDMERQVTPIRDSSGAVTHFLFRQRIHRD